MALLHILSYHMKQTQQVVLDVPYLIATMAGF